MLCDFTWLGEWPRVEALDLQLMLAGNKFIVVVNDERMEFARDGDRG